MGGALRPCCDLGPETPGGAADWAAPPPYRWTDVFGYAYRLCAAHARALRTVLVRHDDGAATRRNPLRRPVTAPRGARPARPRPTAAERRAAPPVSGADVRRARGRVGVSQVQLARQLGCGRSQLNAAELGQRPVDPAVARWAHGVLAAA